MMEVNKDDDLPIIAKRRYPEIMKLLKQVMLNTYPENYDDFLQYKTEILTKIIIKYITENSYEEAVQIAEIINGYFRDEIENFYNESTNKIHEMMGVIAEQDIPLGLKRRVRMADIDSLIKKHKISSFKKDAPTHENVLITINRVVSDILPYMQVADDYTDDEYQNVYDTISDYVYGIYNNELREYFKKRQKEADEETNPLEIRYIFAKHDKPYGRLTSRGFSESFNSFDEMITKYGNWVDVDWDEIKKKLDTINNFPVETFTHYKHSYPLRISNIGDEGNKWGYNFSIIKSIPREHVDESK